MPIEDNLRIRAVVPHGNLKFPESSDGPMLPVASIISLNDEALREASLIH